MGFPVVAQRGEGDNGDDVDDTLSLPLTDVQEGQLLVVVLAGRNSAIIDDQGFTFTQLNENYSQVGFKVATGSEGSSIVFRTEGNQYQSGLIWQIEDWSYYDIGGIVDYGPTGTTAPDPGEFAPSYGGGDTLWLAVASCGYTFDGWERDPLSSYRVGFTEGRQVNSNGTAPSIGCERKQNTASLNPSTFATKEMVYAGTATIGIRGGGGSFPPVGSVMI